MPSIAVVIPAYNSERTVGAALTSVLNQKTAADEIIVVDDGSTDATASVVKGVGGRVVLLNQENQGSAVARQTGTAVATADFIAYLDADDWWPENKIARCKEIISAEKVDFMLADLQRARPGDAAEAYLPRNISFFPWARGFLSGAAVGAGEPKLYKLQPEHALQLFLRGFPVFPSTMVVRRSVVAAVGGWDGRFRRCQDFDIGLRLARRFPLHYLDEVQAILGLHDGNADAYSYCVKQTEGDIHVLLAHLAAEPVASAYRRMVAESVARKYCNLGHFHRIAGRYQLSRQGYAKAVRWPGRRVHALARLALSSLLHYSTGR